MTVICRAYRTHDEARATVDAVLAAGVGGERVRILMGERPRDAGLQEAGEFAGSAAPDAPVGSFAGTTRPRSAPQGSFAGPSAPGRMGTFADLDRETETTYRDGVAMARIAGHHDLERILVGAGLDAATARRDVRSLHEGRTLLLVDLDDDAPEGARHALGEP